MAGGCQGLPVKVDVETPENFQVIARAAEAAGMDVPVFMREAALAVAAGWLAGGTASCPHMSVGPVTAAACFVCGPLPVKYKVTAA